MAQPGSALLARAAAAGLPTAAIPIRFDARALDPRRASYRHFRRTQVTALICNLTKDLKAAGLAGRWAGVPVRLASRESDFPLKDKRYYRWYFNRAATGVLVNSEATRRTVLRQRAVARPGPRAPALQGHRPRSGSIPGTTSPPARPWSVSWASSSRARACTH